MDSRETIASKFQALRPFLDERRRRLWAATEALALGRGGVRTVPVATGLQRNMIGEGIRDPRARVFAGRPTGPYVRWWTQGVAGI